MKIRSERALANLRFLSWQIDDHLFCKLLAIDSGRYTHCLENHANRRRKLNPFPRERPDANRRNEKHAAAMPENVQALFPQVSSQFLHHPRWRARLMPPRILDRAMQRAIRQAAAGNTADGNFIDASHERR